MRREALELLDDPKDWKATDTMAEFLWDHLDDDGCYEPGSAALKLLKSMDLSSDLCPI
jgi:hypothetical protein